MFDEAIPTIESQDQDDNLEVLFIGTGNKWMEKSEMILQQECGMTINCIYKNLSKLDKLCTNILL